MLRSLAWIAWAVAVLTIPLLLAWELWRPAAPLPAGLAWFDREWAAGGLGLIGPVAALLVAAASLERHLAANERPWLSFLGLGLWTLGGGVLLLLPFAAMFQLLRSGLSWPVAFGLGFVTLLGGWIVALLILWGAVQVGARIPWQRLSTPLWLCSIAVAAAALLYAAGRFGLL